MNKLNFQSTLLVSRFWFKIADKPELDITIPDHPRLRLIKGNAVFSENGGGYLFTIGKLAPVKEEKFEYAMTFIVIDKTDQSKIDKENFMVFPVATRDDINDVVEECVTIEDNLVLSYNKIYQKTQANIASDWLRELLTSGYLTNFNAK